MQLDKKGYSLVEMIAALVLSSILLLFIGTTIISVVKTENDIIKLSSQQNNLMMVEAHVKANIPVGLSGITIDSTVADRVTFVMEPAGPYYTLDTSSNILYFQDNILCENITEFDIQFVGLRDSQMGKENTLIVTINEEQYLYRL